MMAGGEATAERDVFLRGKIVSLAIPDVERDVRMGGWHRWFNDLEVTRYLEHGRWPVSAEDEAEFVRADLADPTTLTLSILANGDAKLIGVISLKSIDHIQRRAEIAMVTGADRVPGAALEAMALMTQHAFDRLNLDTVYAGTHADLWSWINTIALIGYRIEGLREAYGRREGRPYAVVLSAVSANAFRDLRLERGGDILGPGIAELVKRKCRRNCAEETRAALARVNVDLYGA